MMVWWSLALASESVVAQEDGTSALGLEGVRVVDALGAREAEILVVRDGRIVHLGDDGPEWVGIERRDARGTTVIPGLIDAHVHLSMAPGAAFVDRTEAQEEARWAEHLRAFVASGVTTVLDCGITPRNAERLLALDGPSPTIRLLGPLVSPPGGYVSAVIPEFIGTPDPQTLQRQLDDFDRFEPIGVKVTMESGLFGPIWPLHTPQVRQALNEQPRPLFVHSMHGDMATEALDTLDVDALVHAPDDVEGYAERLRDIPVVTTLSVYDAMLTPHLPERLQTPLARRVVPEDERAAVLDRKRNRASNKRVVQTMLPKLPGFLRGLAVSVAGGRRPVEKRRRKAGQALITMRDAGVELVLGSDSGNWPAFLVYLHGLSTILEAEALVDVGFTPEQVLRMGTLNGARLLGLEQDLGTVEVGKRASLVVLEADPLADIGAIRKVRWVLHDGRIDTPDGWMER